MKNLLTLLIIAVFFIGITNANAKKGEQDLIGGDLGLNFPLGDFGNIANTGYNISGIYTYKFQRDMSISGILGYSHWGSDATTDYSSISYGDIIIGATYTYYFLGKSTITPFILGELSYNIVSESIDVKQNLGNSYTAHDNRLGFSLGGGVIYPLDPTLDLVGKIKLNFPSDFNNLNISAGLMYKLD